MTNGQRKSRRVYVALSIVALIGFALVAYPWIPPMDRLTDTPTSRSNTTAAHPRQLETATGSTQPESTEPGGIAVVEPSSTSVPKEPVASGVSGTSVPSEPAPQATTTTASPSKAQSESPSAQPVVTMSEPTHISIAEIGYEADVSQMTTDNGVVDPPTKELTYRVTDRGGKPGEDADNTVYLSCHSASRSHAPCNTVYQGAAVGQTISLTTETGQLTYRIESIETLSKDGEFENSEKVRSRVPGRLVLVTCLQRGVGRSSAENFVVFAQLIEK